MLSIKQLLFGLLVEDDHFVTYCIYCYWPRDRLKRVPNSLQFYPIDPVQMRSCNNFFLVFWFSQLRAERGEPTQFSIDLRLCLLFLIKGIVGTLRPWLFA